MASILKVNELQHTGGTTGITIDSNGVVSQPNTVLPAACYSYQGADIVAAAIIPLNAVTVLQGGMTMSSNAITVPQTGLYQIGFYHLANNASSNGNVHTSCLLYTSPSPRD